MQFMQTAQYPLTVEDSDNSKKTYGAASPAIEITSTKPKTDHFFHIGAGYSNYYLQYMEAINNPFSGS